MLKYKNWAITLDGEYPVLNTVKIFGKDSKREGEEYLTPTYFPRDMKGAFEILHRVTTTDASRGSKDIKAAIKAIDENHRELLEIMGRYFNE